MKGIPPRKGLRGMMERQPTRRARVRAPAKINLSLRIIGRRTDGYHLLDSVMCPVSIFDEIAIVVSPAEAATVGLVCHPPMAGDARENLASRAAALFLVQTRWNVRVDVALSKGIPIGAGLGGGSSDAAGVLRSLQGMYGAAVREELLREWALELGADVPFFLCGRPARVRGIGERMEPLAYWPNLPVLIVFGGRPLATADVYRAYDRSLTSSRAGSKESSFVLGEGPLSQLLVNDLETAAFRLSPELPELKQRLVELGARGALMTGSGSAIFALWESWQGAEEAAEQLRNDGFWARTAEILSRVPQADIE